MESTTLQSRLENYQRLLTLSRILTSTLNLYELLDLIVRAAQDLTRTEATSILLIDTKTGDLFFEAASGNKSDEVKREVVPPDSIAGWVVRNGEAQIIADVSRDERFSKKTDEDTGFRTRSLLAVPLKVKDRVIGVVEAVNRIGDEPFSDEDIELLTVLSAQAAIAIENSRLFQQNDFVSEMVHELRTPLTSIIAYSELMLRQNLPYEQAKVFVDTIFQEANRLSRMTNDFLDFSRLQSGRTRFAMSIFDLAMLAQEVIALLQPQTNEHNLSLQLSRPVNGEPINVVGDRDRLRQVLVNLTSNAIKYNRPDGSIKIMLEPQTDRVKVSVSDTGKGIPEKDLPHLFEKFFRVPDSEGYARGTGLGLSIVKQIIDAHDSDITVQSAPNVGTTFSFSLKAADG
jgi:signal transduction histidine kinase